MDRRAPCTAPEFQGLGQGPGNIPEFSVGSCNQEERLPAFALGRNIGSAGHLLSHGEVLCTSLYKKERGQQFICKYHTTHCEEARPLGQRLVSCPAAAAVGWVDTHRAQTCPLATQGRSTGKKVGVKEAGCEGGKGGNVFTGVCGGRGCQADAWFQVWVHLCRLFFGKGANVVYRNSSQREIMVISNGSVVPRCMHLPVPPLRRPFMLTTEHRIVLF